jgi:BetR domain
MEKKVYDNHWKRFHDSLEEGIAKRYKQQIERILCISQSAFYRKIKDPQRFLSIAEKQAIARIYNLKDSYLFPELDAETDNLLLPGKD